MGGFQRRLKLLSAALTNPKFEGFRFRVRASQPVLPLAARVCGKLPDGVRVVVEGL